MRILIRNFEAITRKRKQEDLTFFDGRIIREQAEAIEKSQLISLPANVFIAVSAAIMTLGTLSSGFLVSWTIAVTTINSTRFLILRQIRRMGDTGASHQLRLTASWLGALTGGIIWSILPVAYWTHQGTVSNRLNFMLVGVTAGAVVQGVAHAPTAFAFITPIFAVLLATIDSGDLIQDITFTLCVSLYALMMIRSARMGENSFRQGSFLRLEALATATALEKAHLESITHNAELHEIAHRDALTGLLNRGAFTNGLMDRLQAASAVGSETNLILLDLDNFKGINDTLGHGAGDAVLVEIARRLKRCISQDALLARWGGDEFAIILGDKDKPDDVANRILDSTSEMVEVLNHRIKVGLSIGIASHPMDGADPGALMANTDLALYAAKNRGRDRACRFDTQIKAAAEVRRDAELDLAKALECGSVEVWFQPQISLGSRTLVGLEALIRWNHPRHGWIAPPVIVSAAATIHRADYLTDHVLNAACDVWIALARRGQSNLVVAVNITSKEIGTFSLHNRIAAILVSKKIPPMRLELEITEELFLHQDAMDELTKIKGLGVRLAIDDFGTGYSSLAYLSKLSVDRIKIDRSFISAMSQNEGDRVLVQAMVGLGHRLGMEVVAEGVEETQEVLRLMEYGCRVAQGFYFAKPMNKINLFNWISDEELAKASSEAVAGSIAS